MPDHANITPSTIEGARNVPFMLRDGIAGVVARTGIVSAIFLISAAALMAAGSQFNWFEELPFAVLVGVAFAVWLAMVAGVIFSEYPRGDQLAMARLGLATFCRTGLPLLVVLIAVNYATRLNSIALFVGVLYAIGLFASLLLEVSRLRLASDTGRQIG